MKNILVHTHVRTHSCGEESEEEEAPPLDVVLQQQLGEEDEGMLSHEHACVLCVWCACVVYVCGGGGVSVVCMCGVCACGVCVLGGGVSVVRMCSVCGVRVSVVCMCGVWCMWWRRRKGGGGEGLKE